MIPSSIGESVGELALRVLNGESAAAIPTHLGNFVRPVFDWRQMQRWGIRESSLPPGSEIRFREVTAWDQYRDQILFAGAAILLQAALIAWLLLERHRRQRAEIAVRDTISNLAHVNRAATAGELTASIAHEVNQPLAAMVANANAGIRWLAAATPDIGEADAAFKRIVAAGHHAGEVVATVRSCLEPIELLDFVGNAVADHMSQLFACLLRLLDASLRHTLRLGDHVRKYREIGKDNQSYDPDRLTPAGYVVTPKQVAYNDDEQPKQQDQHEHGKRIGQEIAESEAFREEEHRGFSIFPDGCNSSRASPSRCPNLGQGSLSRREESRF
jgi:signal transduction histidine kinase